MKTQWYRNTSRVGGEAVFITQRGCVRVHPTVHVPDNQKRPSLFNNISDITGHFIWLCSKAHVWLTLGCSDQHQDQKILNPWLRSDVVALN